MTRKRTLPGSKLVLATIVATGMAAAPVAFNSGFVLQPNGAQSSSDPGVAEERATERAEA